MFFTAVVLALFIFVFEVSVQGNCSYKKGQSDLSSL